MSSYCDITTIKMIYFAYFHSLLEYGIAFWGNSTESVKVLKLQKRAIRLMTGSNFRTSCRPLFPINVRDYDFAFSVNIFSDEILVSKPGVLYI